jgi:hypothetical protein
VKPGLVPAAVAGVVLAVSLVLGVAAWSHGDVFMGCFLGVLALLSLVQVTYHARRFLRG